MTSRMIWHDTRADRNRAPYVWQTDGDSRRKTLHPDMFRIGQLWQRVAEGKRRD